jgi:hypothetical protein
MKKSSIFPWQSELFTASEELGIHEPVLINSLDELSDNFGFKSRDGPRAILKILVLGHRAI